jgi:hypothetical protein
MRRECLEGRGFAVAVVRGCTLHRLGDELPADRNGPERIGEGRVFQVGVERLRGARVTPEELVQRLVILLDELVEVRGDHPA